MTKEALLEEIQQLEVELGRSDDERGEIPLEIALARQKLGQVDRALEIWRELIAEGSEDGDYARLAMAEFLFERGQDAEANELLAAVKAARRTAGGPWILAAELFTERGDLAEALDWYIIATERLTAAERDQVKDQWGFVSEPGMLVRGRRSVREQLGLQADSTDQLVPQGNEISGTFLRQPEMVGSAAEIAGHAVVPTEVRVLFWPRDQLRAAFERWPDNFPTDLIESEYHSRRRTCSRCRPAYSRSAWCSATSAVSRRSSRK